MNNEVEKAKRIYNLLINGIPYIENEDIQAIFSTISSKIGYHNPPEADVFRTRGTDNNKRSIIMKFPSDYHKQQFFNRYVKVAKNLTLECLTGHAGNKDRFYVHHDLTKPQYEVNKLVQRLRNEGIVRQSRVIQGNEALKFKAISPWLFFFQRIT